MPLVNVHRTNEPDSVGSGQFWPSGASLIDLLRWQVPRGLIEKRQRWRQTDRGQAFTQRNSYVTL